MKITSSAFENEKNIPDKFTCKGEDISPPLEFHDIPDNAQSLALIVEDPDAPNGEGESDNHMFIHWVLYNISPNIKFFRQGETPSNVKFAMNSFDKTAWGGPCPPKGTHRYIFRLYALDEALEEMPDFTDKDMMVEAMHGHVIAQSELIGRFSS